MRCPDCRGTMERIETAESAATGTLGPWQCFGHPVNEENDSIGSCGLLLTEADITGLDQATLAYMQGDTDLHPDDLEPGRPNFPFQAPPGITPAIEEDECPLCRETDGHTEGCPNGPEPQVFCGACQIPLPLSQLADHMNDTHDANLDRDDIEEQYLHVREMMKTMGDHMFHVVPAAHLHRSRAGAESLTGGDPPDLMEVWAAIGYHTVTGSWPADLDLGEALIVAMSHFLQAADLSNNYADQLNQIHQDAGPDSPLTDDTDIPE